MSSTIGCLGKVVVVIPAYNEAAVVGDVISAIPARIDSRIVIPILVDDGSTDETAAIAERLGATVIRHLANLGVGSATRTGMNVAKDLDADIVVTIDADGQHDPREIERLVRCLIDEKHDVVIGSRLLEPAGMPVSRFAANLLLNALTFLVYRKVVSDSQSGFKAFSRRALHSIQLTAVGYDVCSEIIGEIVRQELSYKSLPVRPVYTKYSRSKGQHFLNGMNLILQLLSRMLRRV